MAYVSCGEDPVAVFLDSGSDCGPGDLLTYSAAGEHAEAGWILEQLPAAEHEHEHEHGICTPTSRGDADTSQGGPLTQVVDQAGLPC